MKEELRKCENTLGGWGWESWGTLPTHKQAPLTLIRCLLTHLVKVFFCTRSRSSGGDKASLPRVWGSLERPPEGSTMQTQWPARPHLA